MGVSAGDFVSDFPTIARLDADFMDHADKNTGRFPNSWPVDAETLISTRKELEMLRGRDGTPVMCRDSHNGTVHIVGQGAYDLPVDGLLVRGVRLTLQE